MVMNGGRTGGFNTLPMFVDSHVLSSTNHEITRCFTIVSGAAATTRKLVNQIRAQKRGVTVFQDKEIRDRPR